MGLGEVVDLDLDNGSGSLLSPPPNPSFVWVSPVSKMQQQHLKWQEQERGMVAATKVHLLSEHREGSLEHPWMWPEDTETRGPFLLLSIQRLQVVRW